MGDNFVALVFITVVVVCLPTISCVLHVTCLPDAVVIESNQKAKRGHSNVISYSESSTTTLPSGN